MWLNEETAWTWPLVHSIERRYERLARHAAPREGDPLLERLMRQTGRELLLLEASDWQFLITTEQAGEYATMRFREHCARFDRIADAMETGDDALADVVREIGALDNPFADIQPTDYAVAK